MKKKYLLPEILVTLLEDDEIITGSGAVPGSLPGQLEGDVVVDGEDLF